MRVLLRIPIASPHTTWIPAGASGVVVGGNPKTRQVSIELDAPRTVVTVPWAWVEEEPEPSATPDAAATRRTTRSATRFRAGCALSDRSSPRHARVRRGR